MLVTLLWLALLVGVRIPAIGYDVELSQHQLVLWPHMPPGYAAPMIELVRFPTWIEWVPFGLAVGLAFCSSREGV